MLDLFKQFLDAYSLFHNLIVIKRQLGNTLQMMQAFAQRVTRVACGRPQSLECFLSLLSIAEHSYGNTGVPQIRRYLYVGDRCQADSRVLDFSFNDFAQLDTKLLLDAVNSSAVHFFSAGPAALHNLDVTLNHAVGRNSLGFFRCLVQHFL